jgi:hypothetical protein
MESEAKIIIAFLFKRSGKTSLKDSELYLPLSMELGWFSSKEAQEFVSYTVKHELLIKKDGLLQPNFPLENIAIPVGFTPSKKTFKEKSNAKKEENIMDQIICHIAGKTNRDEKEILTEITGLAIEKNILPSVAALYVARTYELDVSDWCDTVEKSIVTGNTG